MQVLRVERFGNIDVILHVYRIFDGRPRSFASRKPLRVLGSRYIT